MQILNEIREGLQYNNRIVQLNGDITEVAKRCWFTQCHFIFPISLSLSKDLPIFDKCQFRHLTVTDIESGFRLTNFTKYTELAHTLMCELPVTLAELCARKEILLAETVVVKKGLQEDFAGFEENFTAKGISGVYCKDAYWLWQMFKDNGIWRKYNA